ncbi:MAG: hypothetical protein EOO90_14840 [Pedobacter sp.]|nr:MAG: hypothetical protein EOO90_14840 [Pedobacter sp.]
MNKFLSLLFTSFFLLNLSASAQQRVGTLKGKAIDIKTKKPIEFVSYAVKNVKDSTSIAMGATTTEGIFSAKGLPLGQYKFYMALIGYKPILKLFEITPQKLAIDFGEINLEEDAITLNSVLIKGELLPMIIKKDTIEFSADAFKAQSDASLEDALKMMPGMEIDKDGAITFNGRKIDRVLVDGKEFFGNDPKAATQNLPKDIISKIQVIEKKTEDAIFKGIDDGKRENVINVVLKDDKKKGTFGNIATGKGNGSLYDASLNINRFNNKRQLSVISMANNINKTNFSFNDMNDFLGGDVFGSGMVSTVSIDAGGAISIGFEGDIMGGAAGGGINDNKGIGLNFNDEWGKNPKYPNKISANFMSNRNYGIRESLNSRLNLLGADSYFNDTETGATNTTNRHRLSMRLDIPIDSMNKLQISPNFGFSGGDMENVSAFNSFTEEGRRAINNGNSLNSNNNRTPAFGGRAIYNRRFSKKGRTFSLSANGNFSNSVLDGFNMSNITVNNNGVPTNNIINQLIDQNGNANSYGFSADYTEPLSKKASLGLTYGYSMREDLIERIVYDYNLGTTVYDLVNDDLSRNLQNYSSTNSAGLRFNYTANEKLSMNVTSTQKHVALQGENLMNSASVDNTYLLFEPTFRISYKISKVSSLNVDGSRYNNTPTVSQLQPLTDNSNPLQIITGNPNLRPSANNSIGVNYNKMNPNSGASYNASLNFYNYENRIINNTMFDPSNGVQTTFYDNVNGSYSFSARVGGGFKIKPLNLSFNPNVSINTGKNISFLNGRIVSSNSNSVSFGTNMVYALNSDLQFTNRINITLRDVVYNYNNLPTQRFETIFNNLNLNAALPYDLRFILSSNLVYNANVGLGSNNNSIHMANVSMEKMFMKKSLSLKASVSDVFNNSRNTSRSAGDTFIIESVNLGMRRYFLLSLTYRIKKFGGKETVNPFGGLIF